MPVGSIAWRLLSLATSLVLVACGAPAWPDTSWPELPTDGPNTFSIEPPAPIEGEEVILTVPVLHAEGCYAFGATVRREQVGQAVVLVAEPTDARMCAPVATAGSGSLLELGALPAGSYLARVGTLELAFEVQPASTSPGEPPLWWRAAHAVAEVNHVGSACGPREEGMPPPRGWRLRSPRLHHQVAAAFPAWDAARVEAAMCAAQSVQVRPVSEREIRYRHSSSSLCHTSESIGTVWVREDGSLEVRAPHVIDGEEVPC